MATHSDSSKNLSIAYATLSQAPAQASLNGKEFQLKTHLWHDFMPRIVPDGYVETSTIPGSPMLALLEIGTAGRGQFPANIRAKLAWIILDESQVWETAVAEEMPRSSSDSVLRVMARKGPKWGPHINVNVVVQLVDDKDNTVLLQAKHQPIHRTD